MNRPERPLVRLSDDVQDTEPFVVGVPFDEDVYIDVLQLVESSTPITVSLDVRLFSHGGGQAVDDEGDERELRSGFCLDRREVFLASLTPISTSP